MLGVLLALAGCSSDGNGTPADMMDDPPPPPPDPMPMSIDLSALTAGMRLGEAMEYTIQPGESQDSGQVMFGCPAGGSACMVTVNTDGTATYDGNGGTPTVMNTQAAITAADNATKAVRAMAAKIAPAIADPDGDGVFPEAGDLRGTGSASSDDNTNNSAATASSRPGGAATFAVAPGGAVTVDSNGATTDTAAEYADTLGEDDMWDHDGDTGTPDRSRENQFEMQTATPPTLAGFVGSVYERTTMDGKVTDTLTVYSNSEAAGDEDYSDYYQSSTASVRDGITSIGDDETIGTGDDAYTANVVTFATDVSDISEEISVTAFRIGNDLEKTFTDDAETEDIDEREVEGSFNGIPGTYECTSDSCTISTDSDGEVDAFTGTWTFTPTEAGAKMKVLGVTPDADFLTFGYWLQATEDDEGETTYGVRTFAAGAQAFVPTSALEGQATYSGKATGMYAKKTFNDRGVGTPTSSGQFVADATLTATFDQTTAAHPDGAGNVLPSLLNSMTGTVSNFMDASGNDIDDTWSLTLNAALISAIDGSIGPGTDATRPATTTGDEGAGDGSWVGQFYGPLVTDDTNTEQNEVTIGYPTGVAGEFNGHFSNGHVIGAFGATKDE